MANPSDRIKNSSTHLVTESTASVSSAGVTTVDTGNTERIELVNKGPNTVYFRTDGTTPTALAAGNGDQLASGSRLLLENGNIASVKLICNTAETATVYYRLYS